MWSHATLSSLREFFSLAHCPLFCSHVLHLRFTGTVFKESFIESVGSDCDLSPKTKRWIFSYCRDPFLSGKNLFLLCVLPLLPSLKEMLAEWKSTWILKNPYLHKHAQPYHKWENVLKSSFIIRIQSSPLCCSHGRERPSAHLSIRRDRPLSVHLNLGQKGWAPHLPSHGLLKDELIVLCEVR